MVFPGGLLVIFHDIEPLKMVFHDLKLFFEERVLGNRISWVEAPQDRTQRRGHAVGEASRLSMSSCACSASSSARSRLPHAFAGSHRGPNAPVRSLGVGLSRLGSYFLAGRDRAVAIEAYERASHFIREGERIRVPSNSPLRGKLSIKAVAEREIQRTLVLPAVVEADPAHLIKIVPPLTGQVMKLRLKSSVRSCDCGRSASIPRS
jgi:hypothetical protein